MTNRHVARYSFGTVTVDVDTDTADANRWLTEFLTPAVDVASAVDGDVVIRLMGSEEAYDALVERAASATRLTPCFALDSRLIMLPSWNDGDATVLSDANLGCFYRVHGRRVDIVSRPHARRARLGLMRIVREALTVRRLALGGILDLHAAAFEADRHAVLIAGPKYAGKTTLLCYALASGHARLIANDRVFVDLTGDPGEVHGVPTLVSIRPETLRRFPGLQGGDSSRAVVSHAGEDAVEPATAASAPRVHSLSLRQLAERLGSSIVGHAPLAAVVFPEIVADVDTWAMNELTAAEGVGVLNTCVYGVQRDPRIRTIIEEFSGSSPHLEPRATAAQLAGRTRFFRCRLGPRAYERSAEEWLDALAHPSRSAI